MENTFIAPLTFDHLESGAGLTKALNMGKTDVIDHLISSGLRGRGGAGFTTGSKWKLAAESKGAERSVICNADEGEPGTFKDRVLLSNYVEFVIDGMTIAGYAIGAQKGYIYLRGEYTYIQKSLEKILKSRRQKGLLCREFDIEIRMGAGAYICGEETALIESMEGFRGEPRDRPPFPVSNGYNSMPSVVDNVETFACVAAIFDKGINWFNSTGTDKSKGYKIYSVSGDCNNPGIFELPFGAPLSELIDLAEAANVKAVQAGGASGQCIPATEFHRSLSFEDISTSGSIIIFGQHRDMLKVAENFLEFFEDESCGQCTPCREGVSKLLDGVKLMLNGSCTKDHLDNLIKLSETMQIASKCGLGQSAPNAFLSIVKNFKSEILGRIRS